jgi:hypothetical protein
MNLSAQLHALDDYFVPSMLLDNPETARRARLVVRFAFIGGVFGWCYAIFYLCIAHFWGAAIIIACDTAMVSVPWLLRKTGRLALAGNLHAFILTIGFCGLTSIEGGVHGHAIAWLASVPLCVLLLVDSRAAVVWCGICFLATSFFSALEAMNISVPLRYPVRWHSTVTGAGYLGLTIFLSSLGVIFDTGRKRAFRKMQDALHDLAWHRRARSQEPAHRDHRVCPDDCDHGQQFSGPDQNGCGRNHRSFHAHAQHCQQSAGRQRDRRRPLSPGHPGLRSGGTRPLRGRKS